MIGSELEIHIVLLYYVKEETTKFLFHLAMRGNVKIAIQEDGTSRAVTIKVKSHNSINATIVLNYEVELLVAFLHVVEIQVEPLLACSYSYASPIEIFCLCTSVVNDFLRFIHIC